MFRILLILFSIFIMIRVFVDFSGVIGPQWRMEDGTGRELWNALFDPERPFESVSPESLKQLVDEHRRTQKALSEALGGPLDLVQSNGIRALLKENNSRLRVFERELLVRWFIHFPYVKAILILILSIAGYIGLGYTQHYFVLRKKHAIAKNRLKAWSMEKPEKQYQFELKLRSPGGSAGAPSAVGSLEKGSSPFSIATDDAVLAPLTARVDEAIPELPPDSEPFAPEWTMPPPPGWGNVDSHKIEADETPEPAKAVSKQIIVGNYQLMGQIGEGSMARVFLAERRGLDGFHKRFAVKLLRRSRADDPALVDRLINEARAGSLLNHPNVVTMFDFFQEDHQRFLVMEFVDGATLGKLLHYLKSAAVALPPRSVVKISKGLCEGLAYIHAARDEHDRPLKFVHRDLKPANVLLGKNGEVKIADFGVARASTNINPTLDSEVQLRGTIRYMSPEQARCAEIDARSDLFALGVILFEMLTLNALYPEGDPVPLLARAQRGEIGDRLTLLSGTDSMLAEIVEKLLMTDRALRYQKAEEVLEDLDRCETHLPPDAVRINDLVTEAMNQDFPITDRSQNTVPIEVSV